MAKPKKLESGSWFIQFMCKGVRKSGTFPSSAQAKAWEAVERAEILKGHNGEIPDKTFGDLLTRYAAEVSVTKKGERWEVVRIGLMMRDEIAKVKLARLNETHVADWRDRRLQSVSGESVRREWNLLSNACAIAIKEWKWLKHNPFTNVRRPAKGKDRDRLFTCTEIDLILAALGWDDGIAPSTLSIRVGYALLWALETGMRAGEICALAPSDVSATVATVRAVDVGAGKSAAAKRKVPLTRYAREIAQHLIPYSDDTLFGLRTSQIDALFRKARDKCGIENLHLHDSRANAIVMLSQRMDIMDLARAIGHTNLKQLMVYYRKTAEDIASGWTPVGADNHIGM